MIGWRVGIVQKIMAVRFSEENLQTHWWLYNEAKEMVDSFVTMWMNYLKLWYGCICFTYGDDDSYRVPATHHKVSIKCFMIAKIEYGDEMILFTCTLAGWFHYSLTFSQRTRRHLNTKRNYWSGAGIAAGSITARTYLERVILISLVLSRERFNLHKTVQHVYRMLTPVAHISYRRNLEKCQLCIF